MSDDVRLIVGNKAMAQEMGYSSYTIDRETSKINRGMESDLIPKHTKRNNQNVWLAVNVDRYKLQKYSNGGINGDGNDLSGSGSEDFQGSGV